MSFFMADQKILKSINYPQGYPFGYDSTLKSIQDLLKGGLIAHWDMSKTADNKIIENVNGYDAVIRNGINNPNGLIGDSLTFNGITEVDLGILPAAYSQYTLSMWIYIDNSLTIGTLYYAARNANDDFLITIENGYLKCINYIGEDTFSLITPNTLSPEQWIHILHTYNGELKRLYIGNELVGEQAVTGHLLGTTEYHNMGYYSPTLDNYYKGSIDQVRFYDKVATLEERNALHLEGS